MGRAPAPDKKRKKLKGTSYTSSTGLKNNTLHSAHNARTLQTKKLKKTAVGGFTVASSRGISRVSVPYVEINDPRSTEDILESWISPSEDLGWDEDYINSFIENDLKPPEQDPELPPTASKRTTKGDAVLREWSTQVDSFLRMLLIHEGRGNSAGLCNGRHAGVVEKIE